MAKSFNSISRLFNPIATHLPNTRSHKLSTFSCSDSRASSSSFSSSSSSFSSSNSSSTPSDRVEASQSPKKNPRKVAKAPRRLISISTAGARWQGQWSCDFVFTLRELQLEDLAEDGDKDAEVSVTLSIQKHAGFGFSIDGRVITSFNRKCSCCFSSYCREIDTTFDVWVLPSSRNSDLNLPEIGGNDPSVIYVKPGSEADLDSLIQDTIRLSTSAKDTCSESCEKSAVIWQYNDGKRDYDQRWSRLLELKKAM
ncbi:large ribosomal RNA subunit accumulation protein YCED homolog 2, chloroplastic isoform X1 [Typha angustifolia]|uniref:large ribosomal RNA subunit accumulation protein YCED homolog 2, chloroplastic isoform X1 n=1 Tax=Typha angustifolia TaxID=59011 RepID=UPI003C309564